MSALLGADIPAPICELDGRTAACEKALMYVAMNQFRVDPNRTDDFEKVWRERTSLLNEVPGFREFHLLRGPAEEGAHLYASHTTWDDEAAFTAWTESEAFRKAHARGRGGTSPILGPPKFTGWTAVL